MMEKEAIEKIESLVDAGRTVEVDGMLFSSKEMRPVMYEPGIDAIRINSLLGFCNYINHNFDKTDPLKNCMVVVNDINHVTLVSSVYGNQRNRDVWISACIDEHMDTFPFDHFMAQEDFAIRFRSSFVEKDGDDTQYVLSYANKLTGGTQLETEDDGVTQKVNVKRGISGQLSEKQDVKPIVRLSPYRTFREIEQPQSEFLFRVRLDESNVPTIALFEADGGAWRNEAKNRIAEYVSKMCDGIKIIA